MKTFATIRNQFLSLIFTLYSVYVLYILIGLTAFGGLINTENITKMKELNDDT